MCCNPSEQWPIEKQKITMELFIGLCDKVGLIHQLWATPEGHVGFRTKVNRLTKDQYKSGRAPGDD